MGSETSDSWRQPRSVEIAGRIEVVRRANFLWINCPLHEFHLRDLRSVFMECAGEDPYPVNLGSCDPFDVRGDSFSKAQVDGDDFQRSLKGLVDLDEA